MIKVLDNFFKRCYSLAVINHYNEIEAHFNSVTAERYNRQKLKNVMETSYCREEYFGSSYDTLILKLKSAFKQMSEQMRLEIMGYVLNKYAKLQGAKRTFDVSIELDVIERIQKEVFDCVEAKPVTPTKKAKMA